MKKYILPLNIIIFGALLVSFHITALNFSLYWVWDWFDIMMHTLGGFLVALFGVWVYSRYRKEKLLSDKHYFVLVNILLFVTIVGLLWESFELVYELTLTDRTLYIKDTIVDFIMNTIGAVIGYFYAKVLAEIF